MTLCHEIATRLAADPAILGIRTRRLIPDIRMVYGCSFNTAATAVALARRWIGK
jgi:hypothetical protein